MSSSANPFDVLSDIARKSIELAAGLPEQDQAVELWNGIGFTIADTHYVAAMGSVSEILHVPKFTAVPGVQSWMLGVANVRGRLLPVMDLGRFFGLGHSSAKSRDKRVLVIEYEDILSGFIVDGVLGMQYFSADSFENEVSDRLPAAIQPFVKGRYMKNDIQWNVFDTFVLTEDPNFLDVAVGSR